MLDITIDIADIRKNNYNQNKTKTKTIFTKSIPTII